MLNHVKKLIPSELIEVRALKKRRKFQFKKKTKLLKREVINIFIEGLLHCLK